MAMPLYKGFPMLVFCPTHERCQLYGMYGRRTYQFFHVRTLSQMEVVPGPYRAPLRPWDPPPIGSTSISMPKDWRTRWP